MTDLADTRTAPGIAPPNAAVLRIMDALHLAATAHANQRRKGAAQEPYINHLIEVASLVAEATGGQDETAILAALLHDTIEDTALEAADLADRFGAQVAGIVAELSDDMTLPKPERRAARVAAAPHKSPQARLVKTADMISNLRAIAKSPPAGWGTDRQSGYLADCRALVAALAPGNADLTARFAETVADVEDAIARRRDPDRMALRAAVAELDASVGQRVHMVYLANTRARPLGPTDLDRLATRVAERFPSAVIQSAEGVYDGIRRPILIARIRSETADDVVALAQGLCVDFQERFVGIETEGRYIRIYADDTA